MSNPFKKENRDDYTDLSTVESQRNDLVAEEFPEGPYGSNLESSLGKDSPWRADQRPPNRFDYENRSLHKDWSRDHAGADESIQTDMEQDS